MHISIVILIAILVALVVLQLLDLLRGGKASEKLLWCCSCQAYEPFGLKGSGRYTARA